METSVKEQLHRLIDEADEDRLNEIYDWLHEGVPEAIQYSPAEIKMFYDRLSLHESGESESHTVEESFAFIRANKR